MTGLENMKYLNRVLCVLMAFAATPAYAYLDPGTGSMLLQVILGGVAAVGVAVKLYWHRILAAMGMRRKPDTEEESD